MVTLNAWRTELLERSLSSGSFAFFLEAQNDALTSHVLASYGSWRSALKALRSCIENVLFCLYYKDHPVELQLWQDGHHKLAFSEMLTYFTAHPLLAKVRREQSGLKYLSDQYSVLSRAVHASAKTFRMSVEGIGVQLWAADTARLGKWSKNEKDVLTGINRLLLVLFADQLQGNRLPGLRKAVGLLIPSKYHADVKKKLGVTLVS